MRQRIFTLFLIAAVALVSSCRKDHVDIDIKTYDQQQIENYINAHGLTGMKRDMTDGDTTGIYYQLLLPPAAAETAPIDYADQVSFVFTVQSVDGKFISADTIQNHSEEYLGHLNQTSPLAMPKGVQLAIHNLLKYKGASARFLIPSHLGYGASGLKTAGSSTVANTSIAGNQCLDFYVHVIDSYKTYDQQVITNRVSDLSTYTKQESTTKPGYFYYYKILEPGTGADPITATSSYTSTYTGQLLNGSIFDGSYNGTNISPSTPVANLTPGVHDAFVQNRVVVGTKIAIIVPSDLGYADVTAGTIPTNSCLRFTFIIVSVTQ
ncbi:MAG: FKBP-type peptidyl-prolyl cis-trans isomerase [Bacteroidota bacterium]